MEVRFVPDGPATTRVDLEHRGLDSYGAQSAQMHDVFGSDTGWNGLLVRFASAA